MTAHMPGVLSLRALNQYRQRDVFAYLSLRYYLDNTAARADQWARKFCVESVRRRTDLPYSSVNHFKELDGEEIRHREMYFPAAAEALAEAALIDACANSLGSGFRLSESVYSYIPISGGDASGIFDHYMSGFHRRHSRITSACASADESVVSFIDIKKFYPSVSPEVAQRAWSTACGASDLDSSMVTLGYKLLADHKAMAGGASTGSGLLTGPMFSHLIANLVLSDLDRAMAEAGVTYCRYVDDIALIGSSERVKGAKSIVESMLGDRGLELHDDNAGKTMQITSREWLAGADADADTCNGDDSWMKIVGDLKRLLVVRPDLSPEIGLRFMSNGFRMPILDYSVAAQEAGYVSRAMRFAKSRIKFGMAAGAQIDELIVRAHTLKEKFKNELQILAEDYTRAEGFQARRLLPRIRYRLGRLAYLSESTELSAIGSAIPDPALALHGEVTKAIATGRVDRVLEMGGNAAQAVAQPIGMAGNCVAVTKKNLNAAETQALAIFLVNGVEVKSDVEVFDAEGGELIKFVTTGPDVDMMRSEDPFLAQLASLHGVVPPRHASMFDTPYDALEVLALDALDPAGGSL